MKMVPLGEVAHLGSGGTPRRSEPSYFGGSIPWLSIADLNDSYVDHANESLTDAGLKNSSAKIVPAGTLFIAMYGSIGKLGIASRELCTSQAIAFAIPDQPKIDTRYLYHFLLSQRSQLEYKGRGGTQKNISQEDLKKWPVPLPLLDEQRRIAAILDKADAIRQKRRQTITHLDALTKSVFQDMFGDFKGKSAALSDVAQIWDCPHSTPKWTLSGKICLRTPNLDVGAWNWNDTRFVDEKQFSKRSKGGGARPGDIILSREGTLGIAAIVSEGMEVCMGQRLVQVRPSSKHLLPTFALNFLLGQLQPEVIERTLVGSTAKHLNVKDLKAMKTPLPPLTCQYQFDKIYGALESRRAKMSLSSEAENALFASLQSRAFRGDL